jgi:quercetin dioxygenase-like cupin family protein
MKILDPGPTRAPAHRYASALLHDEPNARVVGFRLEPHQQVPEHTSPATVLVLVTEGEGTFTGADGVAAVLAAGQSAAYAPGEPHGIRAGDVALSFLAVITPRPL